MARSTCTFLHLADVHLGYDRYDSPERSKDFFLAFRDVVHRHAIQNPVDFVVIAGDLFEHRQIQPGVLNQAQIVLRALKQAGIPVLAIEGNHDNRPFGVKTSWLRYLADHGELILLEPSEEEEGIHLQPWSEQARRGSYLDLPCGVRVIGSQWYGSAAPKSIEQLAAAIRQLPPGPEQVILMFHHGLEGQIARYQGALRYKELLPLREAGVGYLALGHIHKSYSEGGWVFNPGSLEANSTAEWDFERGAYRVTWGSGEPQAELVRDYYQRPCQRLRLEVKGKETPEQVTAALLALAEGSRLPAEEPEPIVEVRLVGQVGFTQHDLDVRALQRQLKQVTGALILLFRFEATPVELGSAAITLEEEGQRLQIEEKIYTDLLSGHSHYRKRSVELARLLLDLKEKVLDGQEESEIYAYLSSAFLGEED
ncbi:metallophosphoesterase family protein [Thermostichus vulcanus]|uniref:Nuclease SbcCD subunit D n=1 Tax=Thermostichus vulcanus str. 'Rupite' TaxID=2813851 RepID=A0ABT0CB17_THEVL|nr:exonuclease SbcCD subunit D [Thermostichus vulcanus]MCJ2542977.1 exonuclease SbcCD subunit D [Thermostichus vulcanus str. 'Rupite']